MFPSTNPFTPSQLRVIDPMELLISPPSCQQFTGRYVNVTTLCPIVVVEARRWTRAKAPALDNVSRLCGRPLPISIVTLLAKDQM